MRFRHNCAEGNLEMTAKNANDLTNQIRLMASGMGARLWRRNTGMGWAGRSTRITKAGSYSLSPGDVIVHKANPLHTGEKGQFDLYGWKPVTITADMIGKTLPVHVEIEVKFGDDRESTEQKSWGAFCAQQGVRVGVARTVGDAERVLVD